MAQPRRTDSPHDDPEHPGKPPSDPEHPEHPHGAPPGQDKPEAPEDVPEPTHPMVDPDAPYVDPHARAQEIEPQLGFEEFLALAPALASRSVSVQKATQAALQRWMQTQRLDPHGHYTRADWVKFYDAMLTHV